MMKDDLDPASLWDLGGAEMDLQTTASCSDTFQVNARWRFKDRKGAQADSLKHSRSEFIFWELAFRAAHTDTYPGDISCLKGGITH